MTPSCCKSDKIHLCIDHYPEDISGMMPVIEESILNNVPQDDALRITFLKWTNLTFEHRQKMHAEAEEAESKNARTMMLCLIYTFIKLEYIQNTEGAMGVARGVFAFTCQPQLDLLLTTSVATVDDIMENTDP